MIEQFDIKDNYFKLSEQLVSHLQSTVLLNNHKLVIAVCGESGSGKSVTATCLQLELEKANVNTSLLHLDSYYKLTPKENHNKRKANLSWVGLNELNIELVASHIAAFKNNAQYITVPVVDYERNEFHQKQIDLSHCTVLIVEGVYSFALANLDFKIFLERTFKHTLQQRKARIRESYDPFVEQVLEIEHAIIAPFIAQAHVIIDADYGLRIT